VYRERRGRSCSHFLLRTGAHSPFRSGEEARGGGGETDLSVRNRLARGGRRKREKVLQGRSEDQTVSFIFPAQGREEGNMEGKERERKEIWVCTAEGGKECSPSASSTSPSILYVSSNKKGGRGEGGRIRKGMQLQRACPSKSKRREINLDHESIHLPGLAAFKKKKKKEYRGKKKKNHARGSLAYSLRPHLVPRRIPSQTARDSQLGRRGKGRKKKREAIPDRTSLSGQKTPYRSRKKGKQRSPHAQKGTQTCLPISWARKRREKKRRKRRKRRGDASFIKTNRLDKKPR